MPTAQNEITVIIVYIIYLKVCDCKFVIDWLASVSNVSLLNSLQKFSFYHQNLIYFNISCETSKLLSIFQYYGEDFGPNY